MCSYKTYNSFQSYHTFSLPPRALKTITLRRNNRSIPLDTRLAVLCRHNRPSHFEDQRNFCPFGHTVQQISSQLSHCREESSRLCLQCARRVSEQVPSISTTTTRTTAPQLTQSRQSIQSGWNVTNEPIVLDS